MTHRENPWTAAASSYQEAADQWMDRIMTSSDRSEIERWLERWYECQEQADAAARLSEAWERPRCDPSS